MGDMKGHLSFLNKEVLGGFPHPCFPFLFILYWKLLALAEWKTPMVGGESKKRKREPTPPSNSFRKSEWSEEFSSSGESSPPPSSLSPSSTSSSDSVGLTPVERAFHRAVERPRLTSLDEDEEIKEEDNDDDDVDDDNGHDSGNSGGHRTKFQVGR
jgi:hypothetical protein